MSNGRKVDFLIEKISGTILHVWADKEVFEAVNSVEGIFSIEGGEPKWSIVIDHRYDVDFVIDKVANAILNRLAYQDRSVESKKNDYAPL